jgi:hypothetical protein
MFKFEFIRPNQETPPLARGRLIITLASFAVVRNTQASAGKTVARPFSLFEYWKHPSCRGEDTKILLKS